MPKKCKIVQNVEIRGLRYKVVDPHDPCAPIHRVVARHEGSKVISPETFEVLKQKAI